LQRPLAFLRRISVTFKGLWSFKNGPRGLWQFKTILERFKTLDTPLWHLILADYRQILTVFTFSGRYHVVL